MVKKLIDKHGIKGTDGEWSLIFLGDNELSAAQIEQLREAVEVGMPEKDVLEMAKNRKNVMEI